MLCKILKKNAHIYGPFDRLRMKDRNCQLTNQQSLFCTCCVYFLSVWDRYNTSACIGYIFHTDVTPALRLAAERVLISYFLSIFLFVASFIMG